MEDDKVEDHKSIVISDPAQATTIAENTVVPMEMTTGTQDRKEGNEKQQ